MISTVMKEELSRPKLEQWIFGSSEQVPELQHRRPQPPTPQKAESGWMVSAKLRDQAGLSV